MKAIKFMLEYKCYPLWLYDDNGIPVGNDIPQELKSDVEFKSLIEEISREFDKLYRDDSEAFEYIGFSDDISKRAFFRKVDKCIDIIKRKVGKIYKVSVAYSDASDY